MLSCFATHGFEAVGADLMALASATFQALPFGPAAMSLADLPTARR
jgi:hypothetical protein